MKESFKEYSEKIINLIGQTPESKMFINELKKVIDISENEDIYCVCTHSNNGVEVERVTGKVIETDSSVFELSTYYKDGKEYSYELLYLVDYKEKEPYSNAIMIERINDNPKLWIGKYDYNYFTNACMEENIDTGMIRR